MRLRLPVALLALAGGVVIGTAATLVHGLRVGLVLTLVATVAAVLALPAGWWSRLPFAVGWLLVVFYFASPRPEGDYLVASNGPGYVLLGTGMVIVAFSLVTLRPSAPRAAARPEVVEDAGTADDLS